MDRSYLVLDPELKELVKDFSLSYSSGSKDGLKMVLRNYMKLHEKCRSRGDDTIVVFEDLIGKFTSGTLYKSTKDKISHLDALLASGRKIHAKKGAALSSGDAHDTEILEAINEVKGLVEALKASGVAMGGAGGRLRNFNPTGAPELVKLNKSMKPKERKNYRDLRTKKAQKKVKF
ncbi:MAG: hypothetical protein HN353_09805 [Bdellovibrionales bacterium]|jgi:hypothetical protein|nr:hypothetical protein [Bdellovibrionales bacterium]MBT3527193.1 hypothetical protein [Bdellovibrionales bacterium]MBT7668489.1 hypothetical protein [Bdellovibrionales bacterium]MBT7765847.1 hypothetical protein [Bdellovibrionales bacterium]